MTAAEQRKQQVQAHLRELERWKQRAMQSPDGRCYIGGGAYLVYTGKPVSEREQK